MVVALGEIDRYVRSAEDAILTQVARRERRETTNFEKRSDDREDDNCEYGYDTATYQEKSP